MAQLADGVLGAAGGHVVSGVVDGALLACFFAFQRHGTGYPVDFAGHVVIDGFEVEGGEPTRGLWAHVSECVPAVDDRGL